MWNKKSKITGIVLAIVAIGQLILAVVLFNPDGNVLVINLGWGAMMLSALFGWLPVFIFRRKGEVKGRGYIHTSVLVDSGVYAVVRHPQYLAGVLISIALPMISQHWLVVLPGIAAVVLYYLNTYDEEKGCLDKFDGDYQRYREKVPRMNFILGTIRWAVRSIRER